MLPGIRGVALDSVLQKYYLYGAVWILQLGFWNPGRGPPTDGGGEFNIALGGDGGSRCKYQ